MTTPRRSPSIRLRRLAAELRRLRASAGLTREDVTESTGINVATLYRLETARVRPQARTLTALLDVYGVAEQQRDELQRGWLGAYTSELAEHYTTYIGFEAEAIAVSNYESMFVPGLLQTEDYARALIRGVLPFASRKEVESRVEVRMRRQQLLLKETPLQLSAIVDEAALRRVVGGRDVMRAQLARLREARELPHVTFQVIPLDAGAHAGMAGPFMLMKFPEAPGPEIVYIESIADGTFLEQETDVRHYTRLFGHLGKMALSQDKSAGLSTSILEET